MNKKADKKQPCDVCGELYEIKFKDKMLRKQVEILGRQFPVLGGTIDAIKDQNLCNECWKKELLPVAAGLAGVNIE